jgi:hypothetical protein
MTAGHPTIVEMGPTDYVLELTQSNVAVMGLHINPLSSTSMERCLSFLSSSSGLTGIVVRDNTLTFNFPTTLNVDGINFSCIGGDLGAPGDPILVENNTVNLENLTTYTYYRLSGIYASSQENLYMTVTGNTFNVTGGDSNYAVNLNAGGIIDCGISGNTITSNTSGGFAYGIFLQTLNYNYPIYATIDGNNLSIGTSSTPFFAYGFCLRTHGTYGTYGSTIGTPSSPVRINNNPVTVGSTNSLRYLIYLNTGSYNQGNTVDWSGNTYSTPPGGWTGNYDAGESLPQTTVDQDQPIRTNFGSGDTINP